MNLEEAITTALEYEGRVHRTYSEAAEQAEHDVARRVFTTLCHEEMEHITYLRERLEECRRIAATSGDSLDRTILKKEDLDEPQLLKAYATHLGYEFVEPSSVL